MSSDNLLWALTDYDHGTESHANIRIDLEKSSLRIDWKFDPAKDASVDDEDAEGQDAGNERAKKEAGYAFSDVVLFDEAESLGRLATTLIRGLMTACYSVWVGPDEIDDDEIEERLEAMSSELEVTDVSGRRGNMFAGKVSSKELGAAYGVTVPPALAGFIDEGRFRDFEQKTAASLPSYEPHFYKSPAPVVFASEPLIAHAKLFKKDGAVPFAKFVGLALGIDYWGLVQMNVATGRIQIATRTKVYDVADDLDSFLRALR